MLFATMLGLRSRTQGLYVASWGICHYDELDSLPIEIWIEGGITYAA